MDHFPPEEERLNEIQETVRHMFGIEIYSAEPIHRGWLNMKWKLSTNAGMLFAKQYHSRRYLLHEPEKLQQVLTIQNQLHDSGFPCPKIYGEDGQYILATSNGTKFVLTEFCQGEVIAPGHANIDQMGSLGFIAGKMHALLNRDNPSPDPPSWTPPSSAVLQEAWKNNWEGAQGNPCPAGLLEALEKQREIIEQLDHSVFLDCPRGWMHWDLWVDNILFDGDQVEAIIDFDRMRMLYPEMDVARALLSCALDTNSGTMNVSLVQSFIEQYRTAWHFPRGALVRAFRLLWCLEATNWMVHDMDKYSAPPARFARENIWMTCHWNELDGMFGSI